jgi:hypothetical protein
VHLRQAAFRPGVYGGFEALIVDGRGAGQHRTVDNNTEDAVTISMPWDMPPDDTSVVLLHRLLGHVIIYHNLAKDTSVFGQIWGHLYDAIFDGNEVQRSQRMWELAGWFVQWLNNRLDVAVSYHTGIRPAGNISERTPEGTAPFGFVAAKDIVIDLIAIDHTAVGIELDANIAGAVVAHNVSTDVREPLRLHEPELVQVLDSPGAKVQGPNTIPQVPK